mgnify:CR=1 FL=1
MIEKILAGLKTKFAGVKDDILDRIAEKMQEAYAFIKDPESLLKELQAVLCAVRHVEAVCKNEGFSVMTSRKCKHYIIINNMENLTCTNPHSF